MFDCHMHTKFSADSKMTIEEVEDVIKNKEIGVILTEHMDIDFPGNIAFEFQPDEYFNTYGHYRSDKLLLGVEVGLQLPIAEKNKGIVTKYEFDFVLGSIHTVSGMDLCGTDYYRGREKQEAYEGYFKNMYENIRAFHTFDSLAHLDYIARYCPYEHPEITYDDFEEGLNRVLREVVTQGIALEINTRRLPLQGVIENQYRILKQYKALGGQYVTCGSDAHQKEAIGSSLKEAYQLAESLGLKPVYFKKRQMHYCND